MALNVAFSRDLRGKTEILPSLLLTAFLHPQKNALSLWRHRCKWKVAVGMKDLGEKVAGKWSHIWALYAAPQRVMSGCGSEMRWWSGQTRTCQPVWEPHFWIRVAKCFGQRRIQMWKVGCNTPVVLCRFGHDTLIVGKGGRGGLNWFDESKTYSFHVVCWSRVSCWLC